MSFFLAVDLGDDARAEAGALIATLGATHEAKWQRAEKLHVTLAFLGQPDEPRLAALHPRVVEAAARHAPFALHLAGAGRFVTRRAPTVLWLGVGGALGALGALQRELAEITGTLAEHPWVPHVTLARGKRPEVFDGVEAQLAGFRSAAFAVRAVTLFESSHHQYLPRWSAPLQGDEP